MPTAPAPTSTTHVVPVSSYVTQNVAIVRRNRAPPQADGCTNKARTVKRGALRERRVNPID
jgi:hypothetical protein